MRIVRTIFIQKKRPTSVAENKLNAMKSEKEFDVPLTEETPKTVVKRVSSRDVNLIKTEVKKPIVKKEPRPVYTKKNETSKAANVKTKPEATVTKAVRRLEAFKPAAARAQIVTKPISARAQIVTKPIAVKTEIVTKPIAMKTEISTNSVPDKLIRKQPKSSDHQPVTAHRQFVSPVETGLKVTKITSRSFEAVRKSMRSVVNKTDRNSVKIQSCDAAVADEDESFEFDDFVKSEENDEMEIVEISENDDISDVESEIEQSEKKKTRNRKGQGKGKDNKKGIVKGKRPIIKKKDASRWDRIKKILESGGTVEALPGRIDEFDWIKRTVTGLLESSLGGCLYISGVPGTGKTATTHRTLDALSLAALRGECCDFDFVEINGMRLSDPGQAYSILAKTIFKGQKKIPSGGALSLQRLEAHFKTQQKSKTPNRPCVVLLDELDLLLRKKQSILYHFFEWPNWINSQLIVITIANTMDLPERFLSNRISSRLGLTRYNFKPYDHVALANIIEHQLKDYVKYLGKDAIQLCARKVSAVSGDARRAVNLAKRAIDYFRSCSQEELVARMTGRTIEKVAGGSEMTSVNLRLMDIILKDALMANPVEVISQLAKHQRIMLLSIVLARKRCEEESSLKGGTKIIGIAKSSAILTINRVLDQHFQLCRTHQYHPLPSLQELYCLMESLESLRLLRCLKFRENGPEGVVQLLVHEEDIRKGLGDDQALKKYIRD